MHRRGFLGSTLGALALGPAVGGAAAGTVAGCGGVAVRHRLAETEALALRARLARGMQRLADEPFGALPAERFVRPDLAEHVLRLSIESLLVLDVIRSIPDDAEVPSLVTEALAPHLPRLDRSMHTHHALLARMPLEQRRALDARARRDPEVGMDVAAWIDEHAGQLGVPADNRLRLRHSAMTIHTRLRRQSSSAVIEDCTRRLDAVLARQGAPLPAGLAAHTNAVVDALWQRPAPRGSAKVSEATLEADRQAIAARRHELVVPSRFGAEREMENPTEPVQWNDSWARPGDEERRLGSIMMPLGLVSCGLLTIAGLIVFLTGEAQNGSWDERSHADDATVGY